MTISRAAIRGSSSTNSESATVQLIGALRDLVQIHQVREVSSGRDCTAATARFGINPAVLLTWTSYERVAVDQLAHGRAVLVNVRADGCYGRLVKWARTAGVYQYIGPSVANGRYRAGVWSMAYQARSEADHNRLVAGYPRWLKGCCPELYARAGELRGRLLCCFCPASRPCHGEHLVRLANHGVAEPLHLPSHTPPTSNGYPR